MKDPGSSVIGHVTDWKDNQNAKRFMHPSRPKTSSPLHPEYDASITPQEYRDAVSPYFDRLDANHDGKISQQELRKSFQEVDEAQAELGG